MPSTYHVLGAFPFLIHLFAKPSPREVLLSHLGETEIQRCYGIIQGQVAGKQRKQDLNPGSLAAKSVHYIVHPRGYLCHVNFIPLPSNADHSHVTTSTCSPELMPS